MLHASGGWQEIVSDDGKYKTYMIIYTPQDEFAWAEIAAQLPKINRVIEDNKLAENAHVTYSAEVLTINFYHREGETLPERVKQAADELSALISA